MELEKLGYAGESGIQEAYDKLGLGLAVCAVATAPSTDGSRKILYTVRGTANETYPGWYHTVGGTVKTAEKGIPDPNGAIMREMTEELGLSDTEFAVGGLLGVGINNFDVHPEIIYRANISGPIENWLGQRPTDREVETRFFSDTKENLEAFILGQPTTEVPDARPIVPSGLAGYLLYGRQQYGEQWYQDILSQIPQY